MTTTPHRTICPYCGNAQDGGEQCRACRGLFEPLSRRATQIAMGPWFIRDEKMPFRPGCDYEVLKKLIRARKVSAVAVIRGPTTHQLWMPARLVPGVAHLVGVCHSCGADVPTDAGSCASCGAAFRGMKERNELGLPFDPPRDLIARQRQRVTDLCPVCGEADVRGDDCHACGTVFAPADRATFITLGPWMVRDEKMPFRTGMSYEQLTRQVAERQVTATSLLRGPTTNQFWMSAVETPGVAHLLGFCHACGAAVAPDAERCDACAAPFAHREDPNLLGLLYPDAASVAEAQRKLEEEVARVTAEAQAAAQRTTAAVAAPSPGQVELTEADLALVDDGTLGAAPRPLTPPPPAPSSQAPAQVEHAVFDPFSTEPGSDEPVAVTTLTMARATRAAMRRQQFNKVAAALTFIIPAVVVVFLAVAFMLNRGDGSSGTAGPSQPGATSPRAHNPPDLKPRSGSGTSPSPPIPPRPAKLDPPPDLLNDRNVIETAWNRLRTVDRELGFAPLLDAAAASFDSAIRAYDAGSFEQARTLFAQLRPQLDAIEARLKLRDDALASRGKAEAAQRKAQAAEANKHAGATFAKGDSAARLANELYNNQAFADAKKNWDDAAAHYAEAEKAALVVQVALKAKQDFDNAINKDFTAKQLNDALGPEWEKITRIANEAAADLTANRFAEATAKYRQATEQVTKVVDQLKKGRDAPYRAFLAGYHGVNLLLQFAAGQPWDNERRQTLVTLYTDARLDDAFIATVPSGDNVTYEPLADVIMVQAKVQITKTHGEQSAESYEVGKQFVIVQRLISASDALIGPSAADRVRQAVVKITNASRAAGYDPSFLTFLEEFNKELARASTSGDAAKNARLQWDNMIKRLTEEESAKRYIPPKKIAKGIGIFDPK